VRRDGWTDTAEGTGVSFQGFLSHISKVEGKIQSQYRRYISAKKLQFLTEDMLSTLNLIKFKMIQVLWDETSCRWSRTEPLAQPGALT
jgi:hypothetical protein